MRFQANHVFKRRQGICGKNAKRHGPRTRLLCEPLEDRRVLSIVTPAAGLFGVSPALFVENQGQWADQTVRFLTPGQRGQRGDERRWSGVPGFPP